jgi:hypothetical protein
MIALARDEHSNEHSSGLCQRWIYTFLIASIASHNASRNYEKILCYYAIMNIKKKVLVKKSIANRYICIVCTLWRLVEYHLSRRGINNSGKNVLLVYNHPVNTQRRTRR